MIAHLKGELSRSGADYLVLNVNGVGYKVSVPLSLLARLPAHGTEMSVSIHTVVREDSITLFGFENLAQQELFELLISVNGVGPRLAQNILSVLSVEQLRNAIARESITVLSSVPGVGLKTSQRIAIDLKDKMAGLREQAGVEALATPESRTLQDAIEGLVALGYKEADASKAAESASREITDHKDASGLLRAALRYLSKG